LGPVHDQRVSRFQVVGVSPSHGREYTPAKDRRVISSEPTRSGT
jgi:hypothetical protein